MSEIADFVNFPATKPSRMASELPVISTTIPGNLERACKIVSQTILRVMRRTAKARIYREKYPVFERTLSPSFLGRMTILRKESSLMGLLG